MSLFGGSSSSKSSMSRPDYIQSMIDSLMNQATTTSNGDYVGQQYAGLNANQNQALQNLINSDTLNGLSQQYMTAGQDGMNTLDSAYSQIQDLMNNGGITSGNVNDLASQLYDKDATDAAINATNYDTKQNLAENTLTNIAQQTMQGGGGGSASRLAKDNARTSALTQMQNDASNITNQAYNSAVSQANSVLSGNRQNQYSALGALAQNGSNMAGLANTGAQYANQANMNALNAGNLQQQNSQAQLDNQYNNQIGAQNYDWTQIQNMLNAAGTLNGAQGMTSTTTGYGGGSGVLGGAMSGAAAGSSFGPYGALAGGVIGALGSS